MFLRILSVYFWYSLIRSWFEYDHAGWLSSTNGFQGFYLVVMTIVVAPIIEECLIRYWLYGKNNSLRLGFFIGFCLNTISQGYQILFGFSTAQIAMVDFWSVIIFSGLLALIFYRKKVHFAYLISLFDRLSRSLIVFGLVCVYFVLYHLPRVEALGIDFILAYVFGSVVITYVAKRFGIALAILVHMLFNAIAITIDIEILSLLNGVSRIYYYVGLVASLFLLIIYHYWIYHLRKSPDFNPFRVLRGCFRRRLSSVS